MVLKAKKVILVFTDWYLPGFKAGGPIRSLANLVEAVDAHFYIITGSRDHHSTEDYENVKLNEWNQLSDRVQVKYLTPEHQNASSFEQELLRLNPDRIYLNSLFSNQFTIKPLRVIGKLGWRNKTIVAPRGMLKPGALSIKSNKKRIFLKLANWLGWYKDVIWHATNSDEINEIKSYFPSADRIRLSENLSLVAGSKPQVPSKSSNELKLISIARISPEKGILDTLKYLNAASLQGRISCDFYGTKQDLNYWEACQKEAALSSAIIQFKGEIHPSELPLVFAQAHFLISATWGENFGHAIAEALNHGLPVIITNRTPWQNLEECKAGWVLEPNLDAFHNALKKALEMDQEEYNSWSEGAWKLGFEASHSSDKINDAIALFD